MIHTKNFGVEIARYAGYMNRGLTIGDAKIAIERFGYEYPGCKCSLFHMPDDADHFIVVAYEVTREDWLMVLWEDLKKITRGLFAKVRA